MTVVPSDPCRTAARTHQCYTGSSQQALGAKHNHVKLATSMSLCKIPEEASGEMPASFALLISAQLQVICKALRDMDGTRRMPNEMHV